MTEKNMLMDSFQKFQSIKIAKNIYWFTECYALKDFKVLKRIQLWLAIFGWKYSLLKIVQRLYFLTKYVS